MIHCVFPFLVCGVRLLEYLLFDFAVERGEKICCEQFLLEILDEKKYEEDSQCLKESCGRKRFLVSRLVQA